MVERQSSKCEALSSTPNTPGIIIIIITISIIIIMMMHERKYAIVGHFRMLSEFSTISVGVGAT
jgi:hypothetical protein